MSTRFCPNCGSENVDLDEENHYLCHDCDYSADLFPEKELIGDVADMQDEDDEEKPVKAKVKKSVKTKKTPAKKGKKKGRKK